MDLNFIVFPRPRNFISINTLPGQIIWIPKYKHFYPSFTNYKPRLKPVLVRNQLKRKSNSLVDLKESDINSETLEKQVPALETDVEDNNINENMEMEGLCSKLHQFKVISNKIQKRKEKVKALPKSPVIGNIPCLYLKSIMNPKKIMLAFHGNAEDISLSSPFFSSIRNYLEITILVVEYPGYSIYVDSGATAEKIESDAEYVYNYLLVKLGYEEKNIIVFGRSIGSGPATYLGSKMRPACLVLMSPFTSLKNAVRDYLGSLAYLLIRERFDNLANISQVKSPTFIVHGEKDTLIPYCQSQELLGKQIQFNFKERCSAPCELIIPTHMTHTQYDFYNDFVAPFYQFLQRIRLNLFEEDYGEHIKFPISLFQSK